jgi:hypothetical protein
MTTFDQFRAQTKMRHDFRDQIQVRYRHSDGQEYDTWVSGQEALARLQSAAAEQRLKGISNLDWQEIREAGEQLPQQAKDKLRDRLKNKLADTVEDTIGGNPIGDQLADRVRGRDTSTDPRDAEKQHWQTLLQGDTFRATILQLAWIQLAGSFPQETTEPDDWI